MNITLSAILIVVFLLPGFLFRKGFYNFPYTRHLNKSNVLDEISSVLICTVVLNLVFYLILDRLDFLIDLKEFSIHYYNEFEHFKNHQVVNGTDNLLFNFSDVVSLFFTFWFCSLYIGLILNKNIREFKIDSKIRFFKYSNDWYYYFYAKVLDYPDEKGSSKNVDLIIVDVLYKIYNEPPIIYTGILVEYNLDTNGELKNIYLNGALKQTYKANNDKSEIIEFRNDYLILPAAEIININVRYYDDKRNQFKASLSESKIIKSILQHIYNVFTLYYPLWLVYQIFRLSLLFLIFFTRKVRVVRE